MTRTVFYAITLVLATGFALGQTQETVLWGFGGYYNGHDGSGPTGKLIFDAVGNLYGTTASGGDSPNCFGFGGVGCGTIFELSPSSGGWSETILHRFTGGAAAFPQAGLVIDSAGNLFGTTGGASCIINNGCGAVFELSPPLPGGVWTYYELHNFCSGKCADGATPVSDLTMDAQGNLYGTTSTGGLYGGGTVFELSPHTGNWTETTLYSFCSKGQLPYCPDGWTPLAGVTFDQSGNLYGTTANGGSSHFDGGGVVYELSPAINGRWTETVLFAFSTFCTRGCKPTGDVVFDSAGNLYGTVQIGGEGGGVFRLSPRNGGSEYTFFLPVTDGTLPAAAILIDRRTRTLYGTASMGGAGSEPAGTIFSIADTAGNQATLLYSFCSQFDCMDGSVPLSALIKDDKGTLYGTTELGGYWGGRRGV